jgi:shikimate dehydrogenase
VNTIKFVGGKLYGENTDGVGLLRDLVANLQQTVAGKRILVLGAGGAARGIVGPLLAAKPSELVIANRTRERADALIAHLESPLAARACAFDALGDLPPFDLVLNATSAGLKGEAPPFPGSLLGPQTFCYDLVYSVNDTPFVAWAREHGAGRAVQGWGMLIEQAAESFFIWRGIRPDTKPILKQLVR